MNVKQLKAILAGMDDDAIVLARNRDCINLEMVHVVNHPTITDNKEHRAIFVKSIDDVYGGKDIELSNPSKQAIIFCDGD